METELKCLLYVFLFIIILTILFPKNIIEPHTGSPHDREDTSIESLYSLFHSDSVCTGDCSEICSEYHTHCEDTNNCAKPFLEGEDCTDGGYNLVENEGCPIRTLTPLEECYYSGKLCFEYEGNLVKIDMSDCDSGQCPNWRDGEENLFGYPQFLMSGGSEYEFKIQILNSLNQNGDNYVLDNIEIESETQAGGDLINKKLKISGTAPQAQLRLNTIKTLTDNRNIYYRPSNINGSITIPCLPRASRDDGDGSGSGNSGDDGNSFTDLEQSEFYHNAISRRGERSSLSDRERRTSFNTFSESTTITDPPSEEISIHKIQTNNTFLIILAVISVTLLLGGFYYMSKMNMGNPKMNMRNPKMKKPNMRRR